MEKIGIGLVGLRFGAQVLKEQILTGPGAPYFEVRGVCDREQPLLEAVSGRHGLPGYRELASLLQDESIRVIGLFTPPGGRARMIHHVLDTGRHVMTTKPFERDAAAALEVLKRAARSRLAVFMNSPGPIDAPDIACMKQWQQTYQLGRITSLRGETWCSYREQADGTWYDDPVLCPVAPVFRLGIYAINDFLALMRGQSDPAGIQVMQSRVFTQRPTPDQALLNIKFEDGTLGNIFSSFCIDDHHRYPDSLRIGFERGSIERMDLPSPSAIAHEFALVLHTADGEEVRATFAKPLGAHYPWEALHRYIQTGENQWDKSPEDVAMGIAIIEAMARSSSSPDVGLAPIIKPGQKSGAWK